MIELDINMIKRLFLFFTLAALLSSCGEEVLTTNTVSTSQTGDKIENFSYSTCAAMRFVKPPVDILFVVDNSGSTLQSSFQQIKQQIANTVSTISDEFDYHIYIAPLHAGSGDSINGYPLIVSDIGTLSTAALNIVELKNINSQTFFSQAMGGAGEFGFQRVYDLISSNRSNGIFRNEANTVAVMISNGDDTETMSFPGGQPAYNTDKFGEKFTQFTNLKSTMNADSFRFISLVPHSSCNGWQTYGNYRKMSKEIYEYFGYTDDSSGKDSRNLCGGNYASLFQAVNNSIRHRLVEHKYDHWKISSAQEAQIQVDDITVTKVDENGNKTNIPRDNSNGFEYLGYRVNQNTRYEPDAGEPVTGLVVKLHGSARVTYPDCIIAKTRTPTEYYGYAVLPREPQVGTIKVEVRGSSIPNSSANGWSYEGYKENFNIKVPGPTNVSVNPPQYKSGYFIKLNGSAIYTNGDTINVYYKPKAL